MMHYNKIKYSSMAPLSVIYLLLLSISSISALQIPLIHDVSPSAPSALSSSPLSPSHEDDNLQSIISHLPKPSSPLPWGTLNILSLTDTHGWLRGHTHLSNIPESSYSASIADITSFKIHLQEKANQLGVDLLLVDSGDIVDGNGFVDADTSGVKGHMARKVLSQVGIDIATAGNHELYNYTVAYDVYKSYIPTFAGHYLSSNINITLPATTTPIVGNNVHSASPSSSEVEEEEQEQEQEKEKEKEVPFGNRYLKFKTPNQNLSITAFGILFGFDRADKGLKVQSVLEMLREGWWRDVMENSSDTDVFIILGHMATRDKDWLLVLNSIRTYYPTKPVLIFSGHAHVRDCIRPDPYSQVLASGRYMETLGFTSITLPSSSASSPLTNLLDSDFPQKHHHRRLSNPFLTSLRAAEAEPHNPLQITRRYLDNNLSTYLYHSNKSTIQDFETEKGKLLQDEMDKHAKSFNLSFTFGYAPQSYYLDRYPITHHKSLVKLYVDEVFNTVVVDRKRKELGLEFLGGDHDSSKSLETKPLKKKKDHKKPVFLFNTGGARFNIFKGNFTRDDQFTVIPFDNEIWSIERALDYDLIIALAEWLNSLWGEPELLEISLKQAYRDSLLRLESVENRQGNGVKWDRKNEVILRDSITISARRREAALAYSTYLADEVAKSKGQSAEDDDESDDKEDTDIVHRYKTEIGTRQGRMRMMKHENKNSKKTKKKSKLTFGYVTKDKCGSYRGEGDDTKHRPLPAYPIPEFVLSTRDLPDEGEENMDYSENHGDGEIAYDRVHLVFYEFIAPLILSGLNKLQTSQTFTYANLTKYSDLKANELLGEYAKIAWN